MINLPDNFKYLTDIKQCIIFFKAIDDLAHAGKFNDIQHVLHQSLSHSHSVIMTSFRSCSSYRDKIEGYDEALLKAREVIMDDEVFVGLM